MPKFLKRILYVMVAVALFGAALGFIVSQVPPLPAMARAFFTAIENKQYDTVYFLMSTEYKKKNDYPTFIANLKETKLSTAKKWNLVESTEDAKNKKGMVRGFVNLTIDDKETRVPIELHIVFEQTSLVASGWKVNGIVTDIKGE